MEAVLNAENLTVGINGKEILRGLSFTVNEGEVLAIIGPNGSGKTTLLRALLGIIPARDGKIRLFGKEKHGSHETEQLIAYIPQRMELDRTFPISLGEMLSLTTRKAAVEKYLDMLELRGLLNTRVGDLSGGQLQRALLAYAITKEPKLLIMDEPTSWIDTKGANCILCIMEEFKKKGIAMIIVSHDFSVLSSTATHVLGLGPQGHFFKPVTDPEMEHTIASLFGTLHHGGGCI